MVLKEVRLAVFDFLNSFEWAALTSERVIIIKFVFVVGKSRGALH